MCWSSGSVDRFLLCVETHDIVYRQRELCMCVCVCCQVGRQPVAGVFACLQVLPVLQERFPIQRARMRLKLQVGVGGLGTATSSCMSSQWGICAAVVCLHHSCTGPGVALELTPAAWAEGEGRGRPSQHVHVVSSGSRA